MTKIVQVSVWILGSSQACLYLFGNPWWHNQGSEPAGIAAFEGGEN
jgi:hypothetical protein